VVFCRQLDTATCLIDDLGKHVMYIFLEKYRNRMALRLDPVMSMHDPKCKQTEAAVLLV
jgi:hypothetical protein